MWGVSANLVENSGGSASVTASQAVTVRESMELDESKYRTIEPIAAINLTIIGCYPL
jgi:hypothetical protein